MLCIINSGTVKTTYIGSAMALTEPISCKYQKSCPPAYVLLPSIRMLCATVQVTGRSQPT